jgi:glycerophosphoryl diester phosphodiesterase
MELLATALICVVHLAAAEDGSATDVFFQAHRGGLEEVPENTMSAYMHAWSIPGAIPEMDLCVTEDGAIVLMHDDTPKRTTDAPPPWNTMPLSGIPLAQVRSWDAAVHFKGGHASARVPTLDEVLAAMKGRPERQAYFDLKDVDLDQLVSKIKDAGAERQVIFVHGDPAMCEKLSGLYEGARTMTWLSGTPEQIESRFRELAKDGFKGITQLQFHLRPKGQSPEITYLLDDAFLAEAVRTTKQAGVQLMLRPFVFDPPSLRKLLDLGVRWYVADAPAAFAACLEKARAENGDK